MQLLVLLNIHHENAKDKSDSELAKKYANCGDKDKITLTKLHPTIQ